MKVRNLLVSLLAVAVVSAMPALADEHSGPVGRMSVSSSAVQWQSAGNFERLVLTITTPSGAVITREFQGSTASFRPADLAPRLTEEGIYQYDLRAVPKISDSVRAALAAARERDDDGAIAQIQAANGLVAQATQSGAFTIHNGSFVTDSAEPAAPGGGKFKATSTSAAAPPFKTSPNDVVTADDEIIQGSLCVGLDCVVNESFGFDTIRLKENNTRIKFQDTSTGTGFPNVNWQLTANDSASGGANKFSIDDVTNSKTPFTVTAAAPTNSLFIASSGKVGFGNSSPVLNLHITATDTPAIRQEQTNGGGFTAQTWDIGANEANWFVRDVTGGSRLPLRIRPGAPTSSIDIAANGYVGIGTASPQTNVHVFSTSTSDAFIGLGENPSGSTGTQSAFNIGYGGASLGRGAGFLNVRPDSNAVAPNPSLHFLTANVDRMMIDNQGRVGFGVTPSNPIQHSNGAYLSSGGAWTNASSRALKDDIKDLDANAAEETLKGLQPVTFTYKADPQEHHVGFIAEDVPNLVATKDRKSLSSMDIVAVLTKVVQDQQNTIDELKARIDQLEKKQ